MINPDTENLILIPSDDIVQLEIENVMRVRNENQILKTSILLIIVLTIIIITNYNTKIQDERIPKGSKTACSTILFVVGVFLF